MLSNITSQEMLSVCRPNEELRPIVNTDINKDMAIEMSCLRHKKNLLQRNVDVLYETKISYLMIPRSLILKNTELTPLLFSVATKLYSCSAMSFSLVADETSSNKPSKLIKHTFIQYNLN